MSRMPSFLQKPVRLAQYGVWAFRTPCRVLIVEISAKASANLCQNAFDLESMRTSTNGMPHSSQNLNAMCNNVHQITVGIAVVPPDSNLPEREQSQLIHKITCGQTLQGEQNTVIYDNRCINSTAMLQNSGSMGMAQRGTRAFRGCHVTQSIERTKG